MSGQQLIAGLGNPGQEYEFTRHNLGFLVVQRLAERCGLKFKKSSLTRSFVAEGSVEGKDCALMLPLTMMNNSGAAVAGWIRPRNISLEKTLVVCDDFTLLFGTLRIRPEGSDGGHNGIASVIEHLNSRSFPRLRCGVGHPGGRKNHVDFVLGEFSKTERAQLEGFVDKAADCCIAWLTEDITNVMNQFNQRRNEDE